jgi:hypothetical protein
MRKDRTKRKAIAEVEFYILLNGRLSAEQAQAVRDNLRDFSVKVVDSRDATGLSGTALVMGSADSEWFKVNRPNLNVVELTGNSLQALTSLYGLFGRTLPPILQEGDRPEAVGEPVLAPASDEWQTEN